MKFAWTRKAARVVSLGAVATLLVFAVPESSRAQSLLARHIQSLIAGLDLDQARRELLLADADDPSVALERARLAIYQSDCDGAAAILDRSDLQKAEDGETLADVARGCQRVTAALVGTTDSERGIEVRWQDEHDAAMAPLLFETVAKARDALSRDLGVDWPRPTRIVVVRDLLSLSAMTGLPYASAQTTGTVAVAKWGRVTLLSPRASRHGYPWRDTVAHELTHLAVTRATRDLAPLWLQEGVAKREEVRWRDAGPFDDRPSVDAVAERGIELALAPSLDKLGPSIAMLPSADAAMVAFAEVTSFVRFYLATEGEGALPKLLRELRAGKDTDGALVAASGADLKAWDGRWRGYVSSRPRTSLPGILSGVPGVANAANQAAAGASEKRAQRDPARSQNGVAGGATPDVGGWRALRERSRLGELLLARGHAREALMELDRNEAGRGGDDGALSSSARAEVVADPSLRWLRARALEGADRSDEAVPLLSDPHDVASAYGPWWAIRGRLARLRGDEPMATESFIEAVANDPLDPETSCETIAPTASPVDLPKKSLCDAARTFAEPPLGGD
jgi:hypothetical protein